PTAYNDGRQTPFSDGHHAGADHVKSFTNPRRTSMALMWNRTVDWDLDDWRKVAACRNTEPDLFFPVGTTGPAVEQIESAKRVCRSCEAQEPCLDFALATNQES